VLEAAVAREVGFWYEISPSQHFCHITGLCSSRILNSQPTSSRRSRLPRLFLWATIRWFLRCLKQWPSGEKRRNARNTNSKTSLLQHSTRGASDSRDKVYLLLGLARDTYRMALRPDYSTSNEARDVFMKTAIHIIRTDEEAIGMLHYASPLSNEKLLSDAPRGPPRQLEVPNTLKFFDSRFERLVTAMGGVDATTPSWVPQWEPSVTVSLTGMGFRCAGDSRPMIQVTQYERCHQIKIRGVSLGNISMVASADLRDLIHVLNLQSSRGTSKNYSKIFTPYPTGEAFQISFDAPLFVIASYDLSQSVLGILIKWNFGSLDSSHGLYLSRSFCEFGVRTRLCWHQ
jgi:hypothetical protein